LEAPPLPDCGGRKMRPTPVYDIPPRRWTRPAPRVSMRVARPSSLPEGMPMLSRRRLFPLAACLALALARLAPAEAPQPARTDPLGDSLPPGVVARLGTSRLWLGSIQYLAFSPDGKRLVGTNYLSELRLWDVATGRLLWRADIPHDTDRSPYWSPLAYSPDGKTIALAGTGRRVRLYDADTGRERLSIPVDQNVW